MTSEPAAMPAFEQDTVVQPYSFTAWISSFSSIGTDERGAAQDPDHDGIPNAVEFVVGGMPDGGSADLSLHPAATHIQIDPDGDGPFKFGNYLRFSHRRSKVSVDAGVTTVCEFCTDLSGTWVDAATTSGVVKVVRPGPTGPDAYDFVDYFFPVGLAKDGRWFGRLKVSAP